MSAKEREALARRGGLTAANPSEVVQHQDGGRVPQRGESEGQGEEEEPKDIPPTYDSIPGEERERR